MESVGDDVKSVLHEDQKFFKSDTFDSNTIFVTFKSVTFEISRKCSESVRFNANNDLQEDFKIFKSDTFENYKSFVSSDVHSLYYEMRKDATQQTFLKQRSAYNHPKKKTV